MQKVTFEPRDFNLLLLAVILCLLLTLGFGYFFGRYEQIQRQHAILQTIPEINCH